MWAGAAFNVPCSAASPPPIFSPCSCTQTAKRLSIDSQNKVNRKTAINENKNEGNLVKVKLGNCGASAFLYLFPVS
jgi:hypothetical protein